MTMFTCAAILHECVCVFITNVMAGYADVVHDLLVFLSVQTFEVFYQCSHRCKRFTESHKQEFNKDTKRTTQKLCACKHSQVWEMKKKTK